MTLIMNKATIYFILTTLISPMLFAGELTVYSSRNATYLKPLLDQYSHDTSISVSFLMSSPSQLMARMQVEGEKSPADLLLVTGAGNLAAAEAKGLLSSVASQTLKNNVPKHLTSANNQWFALSKRARTIVYNSDKVDVNELEDYKGLADIKWKGKLCLRTSESEYNRTLIAMLIKQNGEQNTVKMLTGWVSNLATKPFKEDAHILEAISQGQCDVGIVNSYYYARLKRKERGTSLKLFWPNQNNTGVHMNITGVGLSAHAPNRAQAIDFIEWLTTKRPQATYARLSMEYPVNPKVYPPREIAKWGRFIEDQQSLDYAGSISERARKLMTQVKYF